MLNHSGAFASENPSVEIVDHSKGTIGKEAILQQFCNIVSEVLKLCQSGKTKKPTVNFVAPTSKLCVICYWSLRLQHPTCAYMRYLLPM